MILGIGVDITQNSRFKSWNNRTPLELQRVFSEQELSAAQTMNDQQKTEFFASRFAAKEAFFKAFSAALVRLKFNEKTTQQFDLLFATKNITISSGVFDIPQINVNWQEFERKLSVEIPRFQADLTFSHEKDYSVAVVVISL